VYPQISDQLQTMLSSVLTGQRSAQQALASAAPTIKNMAGGQAG
jgi:hypothetical protein